MPEITALRARLREAGQEHLLRFYDELEPEGQRSLIAQAEELDLEAVPDLVERYVKQKPRFEPPRSIGPAPYYPRDPGSPVRPYDAEKYRRAGEELIRAGKVAAFTVAGGQGTRLGFDHPKGMFPAGAVTGRPLFGFFAEGLHAARERYGARVPWFIMTSPLNHEETVAFFRDREYFGLGADRVIFFPQGTMPSFELGSGRILLADKGTVAVNPDGHGGAVRALRRSGALDAMKAEGVEHISYFQVDNPIVRVIDPLFIGLHAAAPDSSGEMSSKMVAKAYPEEKLGVFCVSEGRLGVIEYSDLPMELQRERLPDGSLRFAAGSVAIHVISVEFVERLATNPGFALPYHRAEKKVECIDPETGVRVEPAEANAVKLERFIFDALGLCRSSIVYETDRVEEFAPIKSLKGVDSVESSHEIQTERAARWLEAAGARVPRRGDGKPDCVIELSPRTGVEPGDLRDVARQVRIEPGARVAL